MIRVMDVVDGSGSSNHRKTNAEGMVNGDDEQVLFNSGTKSKYEKEKSGSSSSSSDSSSEEDFFQLDASELSESITENRPEFLPQVGDGAQFASEVDAQNGEMAGSNNSSPEYGVENPDNFFQLEAKQSPPIQVMGRSDVPDPYRIPSSVFERSKSVTPVEWSVASNESLFSIHMGNSSFSRDHVVLLDRSGELGNYYNLSDAYPPIPMVLDSGVINLDAANDFEQAVTTESANAEAMKDVLRAAADEHADKDELPAEGIPQSGSTSRHSDASSIQSFAFPILTEGRSGSVKVVPEQQSQLQSHKYPEEAQQENPEVVPSSAQNKWFPCFSCSFCC